MRKYYRNIFLLTISIGISINVSAQVKLPSKQSENKTPSKQTTAPKQTNADPAEGKHVLKITTNADCYLKIDGEEQGILRTDDVKKIYLSKGEYLIKAISTDNKADVMNDEYTVSEVNIQKTYSIDLQSTINTRKSAENRSKQLEQDRIAKEKRDADEKAAKAKLEEEDRLNREAKEADEKIAREKQSEQERISREEKIANENNMKANPFEMLLVAKQKQEEEKRTEEAKQPKMGVIYTSKTGEQYDRWGNRIDAKETDTDAVFTFVEKTPEFPGGNTELIKFLQNNIKYPATERDNEIEGTVFIKFIVEKDGSVSNAEVLKSISPSLDKEALRVVNLFPNYSPGMQQGKPVRVSFTLPIKFALN